MSTRIDMTLVTGSFRPLTDLKAGDVLAWVEDGRILIYGSVVKVGPMLMFQNSEGDLDDLNMETLDDAWVENDLYVLRATEQ